MSIAPMFDGWHRIQAHSVNHLPTLVVEELQLRASPDGRAIWATRVDRRRRRVGDPARGGSNQAGTTPFGSA